LPMRVRACGFRKNGCVMFGNRHDATADDVAVLAASSDLETPYARQETIGR